MSQMGNREREIIIKILELGRLADKGAIYYLFRVFVVYPNINRDIVSVSSVMHWYGTRETYHPVFSTIIIHCG